MLVVVGFARQEFRRLRGLAIFLSETVGHSKFRVTDWTKAAVEALSSEG